MFNYILVLYVSIVLYIQISVAASAVKVNYFMELATVTVSKKELVTCKVYTKNIIIMQYHYQVTSTINFCNVCNDNIQSPQAATTTI